MAAHKSLFVIVIGPCWPSSTFYHAVPSGPFLVGGAEGEEAGEDWINLRCLENFQKNLKKVD
jgi:hypothetical protein